MSLFADNCTTTPQIGSPIREAISFGILEFLARKTARRPGIRTQPPVRPRAASSIEAANRLDVQSRHLNPPVDQTWQPINGHPTGEPATMSLADASPSSALYFVCMRDDKTLRGPAAELPDCDAVYLRAGPPVSPPIVLASRTSRSTSGCQALKGCGGLNQIVGGGHG